MANDLSNKRISISPMLVLLLVSISIFFSHILVMIIWGDAHYPIVINELLIDSLILTGLLFPLLYYLVFKPLLKQISIREKTQMQLLSNERKFRDLVESMNEGLVVGDSRGKITYVNHCFADMLNMQRENLIGKELFELLDEPNSNTLKELFWADRSGSPKAELSWKTNQSADLHSIISLSTIYNEDGDYAGRFIVVTDITQRKEAEMKLMLANKRMVEANKIKSDFLNLVSHEIRTPVNIVFGFTSIIEEEYGKNLSAEIKDMITSLKNGLNRLTRTIDLILNTAEEISGMTKYELKYIDFANDIMRPILKEYLPLAKEKGIVISVAVRSTQKIYADEYSVKQIMIHIIDNAVKFTEKGEITISFFENERNEPAINIKDTGIGISQEYLPRMFNMFSQEDDGTTRKYDGNGLGLYLVRRYCEKNNAKISVISEKGKGTSITITFNQAVSLTV